MCRTRAPRVCARGMHDHLKPSHWGLFVVSSPCRRRDSCREVQWHQQPDGRCTVVSVSHRHACAMRAGRADCGDRLVAKYVSARPKTFKRENFKGVGVSKGLFVEVRRTLLLYPTKAMSLLGGYK